MSALIYKIRTPALDIWIREVNIEQHLLLRVCPHWLGEGSFLKIGQFMKRKQKYEGFHKKKIGHTIFWDTINIY